MSFKPTVVMRAAAAAAVAAIAKVATVAKAAGGLKVGAAAAAVAAAASAATGTRKKEMGSCNLQMNTFQHANKFLSLMHFFSDELTDRPAALFRFGTLFATSARHF
ncbi:unnamed protein product [Sphagnum compactum]